MPKTAFKMLFLLLILGLVSCSGTTGTITPASSVTPTLTHNSPTPLIQSPLVGQYTSLITSKDIDPNSPLVYNIGTGTWLLNFRADGHVTSEDGNYATIGATYVLLGTYTVNGNFFTIHDSKCWEFWGDNAKTATYSWTIQGNTLFLKTAGVDACPGRNLIFSAHPWTRQV